jgi:hypothetical protein
MKRKKEEVLLNDGEEEEGAVEGNENNIRNSEKTNLTTSKISMVAIVTLSKDRM